MEKGEAEALQVPARQLYGCGLNTFFQLGLDVSENGAEPGAKIDDASTLDLSEGKASTKGDPGFVSPRLLLPAPMNVAPYIEPADGTVEEVACGATFTLALTTNGTPYQWGMLNGRVYPTPQRLSWGIPLRCVQLACGRKHVMALMEGGFVMSWGVGYFGQLGHGDDQSYDRPRMIHQLDPQRIGDQVVSVACGGLHSAVSTAGQLVFAFGFNRYGQCGQGNCSNKLSTPRPVNVNIIGSARISQVVCGRHHTAFLTDQGSIYCWGATSFGRLGLPDPKKVVTTPTELTFFRGLPVHSIACGDFHMLGLAMDWTVYAWGYGAEGQCGLGTTLHLRTPRPVEALRGLGVCAISCGAWWSMAVTVDGDLYVWGYGDGGWLGLEVGEGLPFVEPGPPVDRHGLTCSFDSDLNALLPERVEALAGVRVVKAMGGGAHTVVLGVARSGEEAQARAAHSASSASSASQGHAEPKQATAQGGGRAADKDAGDKGAVAAGSKGGDAFRSGAMLEQVFSWARHNRVEEVQQALDQGFAVSSRDENGNTLLHVAAQNGHKQLCKMCVREGGNVNARNSKGDTPAHFASRFGFQEVLRYLLDKGADTQLKNEAGLSCIDASEAKAL